MHTLFITRFLPNHPISGARIRIWEQMNAMKRHGEVGLFCVHVDRSMKNENPCAEFKYWDSHCIWRDARAMLRFGSRLFAKKSLDVSNAFYDETLAERLRNTMERHSPKVVIFSEPWLFRYIGIVRKFPCKVILDMHNIESRLYPEMTSQRGKNIIEWGKIRLLAYSAMNIEPQFVRSVDSIWACSVIDADLIRKMYPDCAPVWVVPSAFTSPKIVSVRRAPQHQTILFSGNFAFYPNREAAHFILGKLFPDLVSQFPAVRFYFVGNRPSRTMLKYAKRYPSNVIVTGFVEDMTPYIQTTSMTLLPIQHGSGTRLKIIEAMAFGIPIIATTKAVEGLDLQHDKHFLLADSEQEMLAAVERIMLNRSLYERLCLRARELYEEKYAPRALQSAIDQALPRVLLGEPDSKLNHQKLRIKRGVTMDVYDLAIASS